MFVCLHICMSACLYVCTSVHPYVCLYVCLYVTSLTCTHTSHTDRHTCIVHAHVHTQQAHTETHTYIHAHCMYVHKHTRTCMHESAQCTHASSAQSVFVVVVRRSHGRLHQRVDSAHPPHLHHRFVVLVLVEMRPHKGDARGKGPPAQGSGPARLGLGGRSLQPARNGRLEAGTACHGLTRPCGVPESRGLCGTTRHHLAPGVPGSLQLLEDVSWLHPVIRACTPYFRCPGIL